MDEQKITPQTDGPEPEADVEDLEVGAEADGVAGGATAGLHKSGDPEDGGNERRYAGGGTRSRRRGARRLCL
jgi:hypothetical protein